MYAPTESRFEEHLGPVLLMKKSPGKVPTNVALSTVDIVGIYFSQWDKPNRAFTRKLTEAYKSGGKDIQTIMEVVFVAVADDELGFRDTYAEMPWLGVPLEAKEQRDKLAREFSVVTTPCFVLMDAKTGDVITKNGKETAMGDLSRCPNPLFGEEGGFTGI